MYFVFFTSSFFSCDITLLYASPESREVNLAAPFRLSFHFFFNIFQEILFLRCRLTIRSKPTIRNKWLSSYFIIITKPFILPVQGKITLSFMGRVSTKTVLYGFLGKDITLSRLFLLLVIVKCMLSKGKNKDYHLVVAGIMSLVAKLIFHSHIDSSTYLFREYYHLQTNQGPDHVWRSIVNSNHIYNDEEFLCVLCVTQSMFLQIVDLV